MSADHIDRAAEVIEHVLSRHGEHGTYLDAARALDAAGRIVTPEHDAAVAAKALREAAEAFEGGLPRRGIDDVWREVGTNYIEALRERADRIEREGSHVCEECPDCIHNGGKCCGCYDGVCCRERGGGGSDA